MDNRKLTAGILTLLGAGIAIQLFLSTKKGKQAKRNMIRKGDDLKEELKGKFNEFVDELGGRIQGILK